MGYMLYCDIGFDTGLTVALIHRQRSAHYDKIDHLWVKEREREKKAERLFVNTIEEGIDRHHGTTKVSDFKVNF